MGTGCVWVRGGHVELRARASRRHGVHARRRDARARSRVRVMHPSARVPTRRKGQKNPRFLVVRGTNAHLPALDGHTLAHHGGRLGRLRIGKWTTRSVNESSGASAVGFDGRRASQRPRSVASPAMKISRLTRERTGARAYREPVAHFYPWTGAWTRTLAEAALGAEVAGATCIVVKLAQRDCISRVERRRRASRYGNLRRPEEGKRAILWW